MFHHQVLILVLILLLLVTPIASAQTPTATQGQAQETQARGYWIDPATGLMWAGKDNGKDVNWGKAKKYCRNLRLGGFSDWRLATIEELQGIYDKNAESPGLGAGKNGKEPFIPHVKGNLFLTGDPWSNSKVLGKDGHPTGHVWFFDFWNGFKNSEDGTWTGRFADEYQRALCVRQP
jgi:hypothetical protein